MNIGRKRIFSFLISFLIIITSLTQYAFAKPMENDSNREYEVQYLAGKEDKDGYFAQFTIINHTDKAMSDWKFEFDFPNGLEEPDIAKISKTGNDHYIFQAKKGYEVIAPKSELVIKYHVNAPYDCNINPQYYQFSFDYKKVELPKIEVDLSDMEYTKSEDGDYYFIKQKVNSLRGTLTSLKDIKSFSYELKNIKDTILQSGNIGISSQWEIKDIGFVVGGNILTLKMVTADGKIITQVYNILNTSKENIGDLEIPNDVDSDGDGISDYYEEYFALNPYKKDTDGDGLADDLEFSIKTNPLKTDTNDNGVKDGDEDNDSDTLTNIEEVEYGTGLTQNDTDSDGLSDGKEIRVYLTNPLKEDTDGDGVNDKKEIELGTDPLYANTSFDVTITENNNDNTKKIPSVTIENLKGKQVDSLSITPLDDDITLNEDIPGYLDVGYNFYVADEFDSATISFEFDTSLLEDETFVPAIYYFNEEHQLLEEVKGQSMHGNVVSVNVSHFSKYILLNKTDFNKVWDNEIKPPMSENETAKDLDIAFVIDSSGSMGSNDWVNLRKTLTSEFVDKISTTDRASIIDFDDTAKVWSSFTSDKASLKSAINKIDSSGGTNIYHGMESALLEFDKISTDKNKLRVMFILTDGDDGLSNTSYDTLLYKAKQNNILIYTVGLGSANENKLKKIAGYTGGKYYYATDADALYESFEDLKGVTADYIKDSNKDGISDYFTKLLCEGKLLLGTGRALFKGISYEAIQKKLIMIWMVF